jgi:hypothetical protein
MKDTANSTCKLSISSLPRIDTRRGRAMLGTLALTATACLVSVAAGSPRPGAQDEKAAPGAPSLEETRLTMGKWIESQQIISKERKEWQQGKEILLGRLELVRQEVAALEQKIAQADSGAAEVDEKRGELLEQKEELVARGGELASAAGALEAELRRLCPSVPEPTRARIQPLVQRLPEDPAAARVSYAERFQNVLGILNELNKANNEITVSYEVHQLAGGRPAEVKALYVGLAQAYYVSASGEAGIGRPTPEGWVWEPSKSVAPQVIAALEILQGKQSPAFVPLPVRVQ